MSIPRRLGATYRLQLRPGWGFEAAARTVPYLDRLGVETVYVSPVAEAVPGSTHGYDGTDPTRLREELGGASGYDALARACDDHGLGICIDLVPNHLATWTGGPWWRRLLVEGRDSEMGDVFDIDWRSAGGANSPAGRPQVVLPLLDRPVDESLAAGLVRLGHRSGELVLLVGQGEGVDLPIASGLARPDDDVAEVLAAQHYRLADWHDASARNYRRFFDIDGLVGVRVEVPSVFDRTHALVTELAATGRLSALRVDHVDGLRDPARYLRRLADVTGVPIVVEKILTGDEELPSDWPVAGTTGYEVIDDIGGALVDPAGWDRLVAAGRAEGDRPVAPLTVETRRRVASVSFPAELARVGGALDLGLEPLREVVVRLPRYRTYLHPACGAGDQEGEEGGLAAEGELAVWRGAAEAAAGAGVADVAAVTVAVADPARREGVLSLQQLTGAVMAKGVEDTAWYRLAGPLAFCEVGGDPALVRSPAVDRLHRRASARASRRWLGLVPGTTHDTKRSEDVRCRLYALSELFGAFEDGLAEVRHELGLPGDGGDFAFETRVAVQLAVSMVPAVPPPAAAPLPSIGDAGWPEGTVLAERLGAALEKGAREAKRRSSWQAPDAEYEARLHELATALLDDRAAVLRQAFGPVLSEVARRGAVNSLSAVVLRHALPGTPDTYQGDEAWNLSLVDPDNRRPVDHGLLSQALGELPLGAGGDPSVGERVATLRRNWPDGRIKLFVTAACLAARRSPAAPALGPGAGYAAISAEGPAAGSIVAVARGAPSHAGPWVVAVVTRRSGDLAAADGDLPKGTSYAGTRLTLPDAAPRRYRDVLTGRAIDATVGHLDAQGVLAVLPVALLVSLPLAGDAG